MTELLRILERPNLDSTKEWKVEEALIEYEIDVNATGLFQKFYLSDYILGGKDRYKVLSWAILTEEASRQPLPTAILRQIRVYRNRLKADVDSLHLPITAHSALLPFNRESALLEHLKRNNIYYRWVDCQKK